MTHRTVIVLCFDSEMGECVGWLCMYGFCGDGGDGGVFGIALELQPQAVLPRPTYMAGLPMPFNIEYKII